jgi:hypothetical protein
MPRKARILCSIPSLEKKLLAYIAAASATGVGILVPAHSAEAKVVYTPTNIPVTNGLGLDLNHDGINDFSFVANTTNMMRPRPLLRGGFYVDVRPVQSKNLIWGSRNSISAIGSASALVPGVIIRASKKLQASHTYMCSSNAQGYGGPWYSVQGFLGLKFQIEGKAHYGWARLRFDGCGGTLTGYAYETVANKPIIAGKTKGPDVITIQSGSLGHRARGASKIQ